MRKLKKNKFNFILIVIIIILAVLIGFIGLNISQKNTRILKQEKEEGNVNVIVEFLPQKSDTRNLVFAVTLDTHSVDLGSFDFQKEIFLVKGNNSEMPINADTSGSVHHRKGEVTFKQTEAPFSIVLNNLENIPRREFRFNNI